MAKKGKSLTQWCKENKKLDILSEFDVDKNSRHSFSSYTPDIIKYNSCIIVNWKCGKGHAWQSEVVGRTLFELNCPICHPEIAILPVGTKYGCLTIIENDSLFIREREKELNETLVKQYGPDKPFAKIYVCKCKCGKTYYLSQTAFLASRHRYCTEGYKESEYSWMQTDEDKNKQPSQLCGLAIEAERKKTAAYKRVLAKNYNIDFTGKFFESLEVLECINSNHEVLTSYGDRRKGAGTYTVYKLYKCRCYLCGKEHELKCSDFHIDPPTEYGYTAYNGYWSDAECDCHKISSFQWMVNKLLFENGISYRVEVSFPDLLGTSEVMPLKYDFGILNKEGSIVCLIECQGEQHYKPVDEFGGEKALCKQLKNDERKRQYAADHNINLIEISYKTKKLEKIKDLLIQNGII